MAGRAPARPPPRRRRPPLRRRHRRRRRRRATRGAPPAGSTSCTGPAAGCTARGAPTRRATGPRGPPARGPRTPRSPRTSRVPTRHHRRPPPRRTGRNLRTTANRTQNLVAIAIHNLILKKALLLGDTPEGEICVAALMRAICARR